MLIADECVVSFHYTLTNDAGEVLDSSRGREPLVYLHGAQGIVVGLENAMAGKKTGDAFKVKVQPEEGYGVRNASLVQTAKREMFPPNVDIAVGMQFRAENHMGPVQVRVTAVDGDEITLDGNHELADMALNFEVEVTGVRKASFTELQHGHVHGAGGHHH